MSRRGSVAAIAQEVTDVLTEAKGFNDLFEKTCLQGIGRLRPRGSNQALTDEV